ncbi:hypothetical protein LPB72_20670 [Hydrogenophaga crassostreae]|uniref:Phosphatidic acid phosphatase type 2/haloperoxidase domain-containing protein n=2 Tax=Hydrogenophaga crassostreae TaxID=1763535 RepID=A0A167GMX9_9BURK|nr:hypothetical protein LPB072_20500 [Hydrogenophaga crassostreae]OAD39675.1 hypothetical protein LPB72_20670 [Hydrogenophaga crassostreae]
MFGMVNGAELSVTVEANQPNVVAYWNQIANTTVLAPSTTNTTAEEQRPSYQVDLASVHVAIYDAVIAIDGRYKAFAVQPKVSPTGASMDAAASAAAYGVLHALFPNRSAHYQAAYDSRIAAIPDGDAKTRGLALGREVASGVVKLRANDGRSVALAPYISGTDAGQFRSAGPNPFNRYVTSIKPFSLTRLDQFRPPPPPALNSAAYAAAVEETRLLGGTISAARTPEQLETARFHSDPPGPFVTRNLGRFAASTGDVAEAARLMAFIYVVHADAIGACFEAKYHYAAWRPMSAITMADTDGNDATQIDAGWTPVLPTPNHPEYPAAHACTSGGLGETLLRYHGTHNVAYTWDSRTTGTTRSYATTDALDAESQIARIAGGMHFRFSTDAGVTLGKQVAQWVADHHFARRE